MKHFWLIVLLAGISLIGCSKKQALETTTIRLNSMVCNTCAKTITKAIYAVEGVKNVDVDVQKKIAEVKFVPEQTNLQTIEQAVTEAGYDANDKKRSQDAYEKLDKCCKIDG